MKLTSGQSIPINHAMITFSRQFGHIHTARWSFNRSSYCLPRAFYTLCKGNVTVQIIVHVPRFEACYCAVELNHYELCNAILRLSTVPIMVNQEARFELLRRRRTLAAPWLFPQYLSACRKWGLNWNWFGQPAPNTNTNTASPATPTSEPAPNTDASVLVLFLLVFLILLLF